MGSCERVCLWVLCAWVDSCACVCLWVLMVCVGGRGWVAWTVVGVRVAEV